MPQPEQVQSEDGDKENVVTNTMIAFGKGRGTKQRKNRRLLQTTALHLFAAVSHDTLVGVGGPACVGLEERWCGWV